MIRSIKDKETAKVFNRQRSTKLPQEIQQTAYRKLRIIHNCQDLNDLRSPPGNHLEKLSGDHSGQHSIRINDQWRICFSYRDGDAHDVEIIDYH